MGLKNLHKHHQVIKQNHIDNKITKTEQLVKKMVGVTDYRKEALTKVPLHMKD